MAAAVTRGRKVDPKRAKRGTGHRPTAGKRKAAAEPDAILLVKGAPPAPPEHLIDPHARDVWQLVVDELYPRGLRPADLVAVEMIASQAALAHEASVGANGWQRRGIIVQPPGGGPAIVNPLVRVERDAVNAYLRLSERYGLDLASRLRLGLMQLAGQSLTEALTEDLERE